MSQLRTYRIKTGPCVTPCTGCGEPIAPHTNAVMREDRAVFCREVCVLEHDDAQVGAATWQVLT